MASVGWIAEARASLEEIRNWCTNSRIDAGSDGSG